MARFTYAGRSKGGEQAHGILEADSAADCASRLLQTGGSGPA